MRPREEIFKDIRDHAPTSGTRYYVAQAELASSYAEGLLQELGSLTNAIDRASQGSSSLARVGIFLNVILVVATIVVAWATYVLAYAPRG